MRSRVAASVAAMTIIAGTLVAVAFSAGPVGASTATSCALPASGTSFTAAAPQSESLDPAAVRRALAYADTHLRLSVQIFRNNCLVAGSPLNAITGDIPWEIFSS